VGKLAGFLKKTSLPPTKSGAPPLSAARLSSGAGALAPDADQAAGRTLRAVNIRA
jgi:hypothetical protein